MKLAIKTSSVLLPVLLIILSSPCDAQSQPIINERFPIRGGGQLSPPIISPVGDCARAVHVSGFIAHAIVRVFANGTELIGLDNPYFAEADIPLSHDLKLGEKITATQEVLGLTSSPSRDPMVVSAYPSTLNKPVIDPSIFACGQVVPVDHLNPGTQVSVFQVGVSSTIGDGNATQAWQPIVTSPLNDGKQIFAAQTSCPADPVKKKETQSDPQTVLASPSPVPPPTVEKPPMNADIVVLNGLLTGSAVEVAQLGDVIGGGLSTGSRNTAPVKRITSPAPIAATQKLCTPSLPSDPVTPSTTLNAPVIMPVCENTHYVTIRGTYPGAIVVLLRNGTVSTYSGGVLGDLTMALGGGAVWNLGDEVQVLQYVASASGMTLSGTSAPVYANCAPQNVLTQHNDNSRSGAALHESKLTPKNVASPGFIKLFTRQVDGDVVGQPLFMKGVRTSSGVKNLFLVTTSKNNLYAFDANDLSPAASSVWQPRNLCISAKSGVCGETYSRIVGITSTPVIDASAQVMYVVANCTAPDAPVVQDINSGVIRMYAINLSDGSDKLPPVDVHATDPNNSRVRFDPHCQRNRPGLLLSQGNVYAAFATFSCDANCADNSPYHGWVLGYSAADLKQTGAFNTSSTGGGAGIWQTGNGLAASSDGSIYFETGNGPSGLSNSFVKLAVSATGALSKAGSFTPNNANTAMAPDERSLNAGDTDLGSGGPMLLLGERLIGGGKQGRYYVLDQNTLGLTQNATPDGNKFDGFQAFLNTYHQKDATHTTHCVAAGGAAGCAPGPACYIDVRHYGDGELCGPNIHAGPVFWQLDGKRGFIYQMPEKDALKAFRYDLSTKKVTEAPALTASGALAKPADGMPGGYSSISANGATNGIVWTTLPMGDAQWNLSPGRMVAFDALTLKQIWSDPDDYMFAKAVPPTIADGKVVRATGSVPAGAEADFRVIAVYGLKPARKAHRPNRTQPSPIRPKQRACYTIQEKYANYGESLGILGIPTTDEIQLNDRAGGTYREFRATIFGMAGSNASMEEAHDSPNPSCSVPVGANTEVESSIYWTQRTCAHVVQGQIRDYWLRLGGPKSKFGYPVNDEAHTPDRSGRMSRFEYGEIWWSPERGAYEKPGRTGR